MAIIFRGQGKWLTELEKKSWHPDIDVYFQKNAWADTAFCAKWAQHTLKPAAADDGGQSISIILLLIWMDRLNLRRKEYLYLVLQMLPIYGSQLLAGTVPP